MYDGVSPCDLFLDFQKNIRGQNTPYTIKRIAIFSLGLYDAQCRTGRFEVFFINI